MDLSLSFLYVDNVSSWIISEILFNDDCRPIAKSIIARGSPCFTPVFWQPNILPLLNINFEGFPYVNKNQGINSWQYSCKPW